MRARERKVKLPSNPACWSQAQSKAECRYMTTSKAQETAIATLEKQGFKFSNWIATNPDAENEATSEKFTAVMVRKPNRFTREYREVDPEGNIN